jgi:hypothetical protein
VIRVANEGFFAREGKRRSWGEKALELREK